MKPDETQPGPPIATVSEDELFDALTTLVLFTRIPISLQKRLLERAFKNLVPGNPNASRTLLKSAVQGLSYMSDLLHITIG